MFQILDTFEHNSKHFIVSRDFDYTLNFSDLIEVALFAVSFQVIFGRFIPRCCNKKNMDTYIRKPLKYVSIKFIHLVDR